LSHITRSASYDCGFHLQYIFFKLLKENSYLS
jgi:hypothetical protein